MKRDVVGVGLLWLILTAIGELLAQVNLYPPARSDKGVEIEQAFRVLLILAVPVFTFVVVVLVYSVLRFRQRGDPEHDGPPAHGRGRVPLAWFGVTSSLALLIMVYPGLTELPAIMGVDPAPDLVVQVKAVQWAWMVDYPQYGVQSLQELVLPVDRTVRFNVTSLDVIHSFWIPAFLMRVDAVPGMTTSVSLRPTRTGSYASDYNMRVQCSQLCGLAHAQMMMPVRVVPETQFLAWIQQQTKTAGPTATPAAGATRLSISASNIRFSTNRLEARAGVPITVTFHNEDAGVVHDIAFYQPGAGGALIARSALQPGPDTETVTLPALPAGTYVFRCDAHPTEMSGTLEVK